MSNDRRRFLQSGIAMATLAGTPGAVAAAADTATNDQPVSRKALGASGYDIPILQLGTSQQLDPNYDKVMHRCYRAGVTALDTALSYGWGASHRAIAVFLEQIGDRRSVWLTSKSGKRSPEGLSGAIDQALEELQTDYLDLYLMHGIKSRTQLGPEFIRVGEQLKASGKTRLFGFSCHDGNVVELLNDAADLGVGAIDAILFRYNFRRYGDRELNLAIDRCHAAGIGLLAMKTMGSVPKDLEAVSEFRSQQFTLGQAKLKSVWADERIASIVSEMDSVRVARENIAAARSPLPLAAEDAHQLNRLAALTDHYACVGCSHLCESAIAGQTAIADQLRYLSYADSYGELRRARALYAALPEAKQRFTPADLARAASVCPQKIDLPVRLANARALLGSGTT